MMTSNSVATLCFCPVTAALTGLVAALTRPSCSLQPQLHQSDYLSLSSACWSPADVSFGEELCLLNETPAYQETDGEESFPYSWCSCASSTATVVVESTGVRLTVSYPTCWDVVSGHVDGSTVWLTVESGDVIPVELKAEVLEECMGHHDPYVARLYRAGWIPTPDPDDVFLGFWDGPRGRRKCMSPNTCL